MDAAVRAAGYGTADGVHDTKAERATVFGVLHRLEGVGGFAGLRDEHAGIVQLPLKILVCKTHIEESDEL